MRLVVLFSAPRMVPHVGGFKQGMVRAGIKLIVALAARFGLELPLLEDVSYFSACNRPFEFTTVPIGCPE
jgi:hypothetical protein